VTGQPLDKAKVLGLLEAGFQGADRLGVQGGEGNPNVKKSSKKTRKDHDGGESTFFFDTVYELWSLIDNDGPETGYQFFEDHERTKPAGHEYMTFSDPGVFPTTFRRELVLLAGPNAGMRETEEYVNNDDFSGSSSGSATMPGGGSWEYNGTWDAEGRGTWSQTVTYPDGSKQTFSMENDGTVFTKCTITSSLGITFSLNFNDEDGSGNGTITGPAEGLPATISWDVTGSGKVVWSDNTETTFENWDIFPEG